MSSLAQPTISLVHHAVTEGKGSLFFKAGQHYVGLTEHILSVHQWMGGGVSTCGCQDYAAVTVAMHRLPGDPRLSASGYIPVVGLWGHRTVLLATPGGAGLLLGTAATAARTRPAGQRSSFPTCHQFVIFCSLLTDILTGVRGEPPTALILNFPHALLFYGRLFPVIQHSEGTSPRRSSPSTMPTLQTSGVAQLLTGATG